MHFPKTLLVAAVCSLLLGVQGARAAPADPFDDIAKYKLGDPETYRLLSGMGVPRPGVELSWDDRIKTNRADLLLLFPDLPANSYGVDYSDCRIASPLAQYRQRIARLGADHPYVRQWLAAEQSVMATCHQEQLGNRPKVEVLLPPPLATTDKVVALIQNQDRAYQNAALQFYGNERPEALAAFRAIAADHASIDRPQAAFMVVAIQAGSVPFLYGDPKPMVSSTETLKQIQALLDDPAMADVHAMAAGLIGWMAYYTGDETGRQAQVREAVTALMAPTSRLDQDSELRLRYEAAKLDIDSLHSTFKDPNWILTGAVPTDYYASAALVRLAKTNPMAAWVAFPADPYRGGNWAVVAQVWQGSTVSGFLGKMGGDSGKFDNAWVHINPKTGIGILRPMVDQEIGRLKAGPDREAAAALSFDFYSLERQLLMSGDKGNFAEALQRLKDFPSRYRDGIAHDGLVYLMAAGRLDEARRMRDALKLDAAGQGPSFNAGALMVLAEDEPHLVRAINIQDTYPHAYVNALSVAELWRLADNGDLSRPTRALFARAAWTREYALGRTIDWRHDQLMRLLNPEVTAHWRSHAGRDVTPDDRLVLGDVLKSPAMNMVIEDFSRMPGAKRDDYDYASSSATSGLTGMDYANHNDNNWWCGWEPAIYVTDSTDALAVDFGASGGLENQSGVVPLRKLLARALGQSVLFQNRDSREHVALAGVTCAPKFLGQRVIAWVEDNGLFSSRDGQAEALADAVAATRWGGNRQGPNGGTSRHAWELLHTLFKDSAAAKRTPYWFN